MTDDNQPATKGDLRQMLERVEHLETRVTSSRDELLQCFNGALETLLRRFDEQTAELDRHFRVIVENAKHDLAGGRSDQVELLVDAKVDHERRISRLERKMANMLV